MCSPLFFTKPSWHRVSKFSAGRPRRPRSDCHRGIFLFPMIHDGLVDCWLVQWPFQVPKLEVPTIYKAYKRPKFQGISPQNMAKNMVLAYLHFRILEISHWHIPLIDSLVGSWIPHWENGSHFKPIGLSTSRRFTVQQFPAIAKKWWYTYQWHLMAFNGI